MLSAQGFDRPRPHNAPTANEIRAVLQQVGLLQLDSVNVFCRSHYMPLFSRLGSYDRGILDRMAAHTAQLEGRELIEYWGHEASLLIPELYTLLRWRRNRADREAWKFVVKLAHDRPELVRADPCSSLPTRGQFAPAQTSQKRPEPHARQMWNWHDGKNALEYLFYDGRVASAGRINFERLYDLPDRVLPRDVLAASRDLRARGPARSDPVRGARIGSRDRERPRRLLPPDAHRLQATRSRAGRCRRTATRQR